MELHVNEIQIPDRISFNYEELKRELSETLKRYETMIYTADEMKAAKADRAALNKLKKALNDERIKREREYMAPFEEFKRKIAELISIIDKPVSLIDRQIKDFEENQKREKYECIESCFLKMMFPEWVTLDRIFNQKWLNATTSLNAVGTEMEKIKQQILDDLHTLSELPSFAFEATEMYKLTLDIGRAVSEGKRLAEIEQRKAEEQQAAVEAAEMENEGFSVPPLMDTGYEDGDHEEAQESGTWISFKAYLTVKQALALRDFFRHNEIDFQAI